MIGILSAFGLAAATGLNAYLPLLIVGLFARFTDLVQLSSPWDALSNAWVLVLLGILLAIEVTVDKIPAVDSINDVIQTVIRPAAGAILFASSSNAISEMSPVLAIICGILMAGSVHAVKAVARPVVTASTLGVGNSVVSTAEDVASGVTTLLAVLVPSVAAILVLAAVIVTIRWIIRRRRIQHSVT